MRSSKQVSLPLPGRRPRQRHDEYRLAGIVAEMVAAFERHERALVSNDAGMLDGRLRADALSGPLTSPALLENIGKTSTPDGRKTNVPFGRGQIQLPGSLNLSRKDIIPAVAKGSACAWK